MLPFPLRLRSYGFLLAVVFLCKVFSSHGAEHKFILDSWDKIKEDPNLIKNDLQIQEHDDEMVVHGEFDQMIDFDEKWKVHIEIFRSPDGNEEYKTMMKLPPKDVCELMKTKYKQYFYESLKNYANAPDPDKCPVVKEKYVVNKYPLDSSKFKKLLKPGYYQVHMSLFDGDEVEHIKYSVNGHVVEVE